MSNETLKEAAAKSALEFVQKVDVIGIGTGSTVNFFIQALSTLKHKVEAVASSVATEGLLKAAGIPVLDLNSVGTVPVYVDGADEFNLHKQLIKGGGGALTREKILAAAAKKFICIVDATKQVNVLGKFPLPIEVIPMARGYVARELLKMGGDPEYRQGFVTDNGNIILDVYNLNMVDPIKIESEINQITGVVCNGLFAKRAADLIIVADKSGMKQF